MFMPLGAYVEGILIFCSFSHIQDELVNFPVDRT